MEDYSEYFNQIYEQLEGREGETLSTLQFWHRLEIPEIDELKTLGCLLEDFASETEMLEEKGRNGIGKKEYSVANL